MGVYFAARSNFVFLVVLTVLCRTNFVNGVDLDKRSCGETLQIGDRGGTLVSPNFSCTVSLQSSISVEMILLTFDRVNIDCTAGDVLEIFNGVSTGVSDKLKTICGSTPPAEVTSSSNGITLKFRTNNETQDAGFRIVFTAFALGECGLREFKCKNGRCIDKRLMNNSNDNCGDRSDEPAKAVTGLLRWGIPIFIVILVAIVVAVILLCVCSGCLFYYCCHKSTPKPQNTTVVMSPPDQKYGVPYATLE